MAGPGIREITTSGRIKMLGEAEQAGSSQVLDRMGLGTGGLAIAHRLLDCGARYGVWGVGRGVRIMGWRVQVKLWGEMRV